MIELLRLAKKHNIWVRYWLNNCSDTLETCEFFQIKSVFDDGIIVTYHDGEDGYLSVYKIDELTVAFSDSDNNESKDEETNWQCFLDEFE